MSDSDDDNQDNFNETGTYRIEKPSSIDRYFGKLSSFLKFLQAEYKTNLGKTKDTKLSIKTSKTNPNSSIVPTTKINFSIKEKKHKLSIGFKPYCMVPSKYGGLYNILYPFEGSNADLTLNYSTKIFDHIDLKANIKDKGQSNIKISGGLEIFENALKLNFEHLSEITKKGKLEFKNSCELTAKTETRREQINKDYYCKLQEKLGAKISDRNDPEYKMEASFQILSEQLKNNAKTQSEHKDADDSGLQEEQKATNDTNDKKQKKEKPLHQIKFYHCHKIIQREKISLFANSVKSTFLFSENLYNTNLKLDLQHKNRSITSWQWRYFTQRGQWRAGISLGNSNNNKSDSESGSDNESKFNSSLQRSKTDKKWQVILQKDCFWGKRYLNIGGSYSSQSWGVQAWGKISRKHKYQVIMQKKHSKNDDRDKKAKPEGFKIGIKYTYNQ